MKQIRFVNKKWAVFLFLCILTGIAFFLRFRGLSLNIPFWVDEFSSAHQARLILEHGLSVLASIDKSPLFFEHRNIPTHFLIALSFTLFGQSEWAARLPIVLLGSLIPACVFLLTNYLAGIQRAIIASLLITFSYFEITWSKQAKSYILEQLLTLLLMYVYFHLLHQKKNLSLFIGLFVIIVLLGSITHPLFYIVLAAIALHFIVFHIPMLKKIVQQPVFYIGVILVAGFSVITGNASAIIHFFNSSFFTANNLWYYHPFLWREYGLITFLGIIGLCLGLLKRKKELSLILLYMLLHLFFITFIFAHHITKYTLPIIPFLFIGMAYALYEIVQPFTTIKSKNKYITWFLLSLPTLITLIIIANGHKFVLKPKLYYSLNRDFREISNIDYHQIYAIIKQKGALHDGKTAVIDTWPDRSYWYLGTSAKKYLYYFHWENEPGMANGHVKQTAFVRNSKGEKVISTGIRFIGKLSDLKQAMKTYQKGFIFIDDDTLPKDVRDYAAKNLKKELFLDHYTLDDNPYSIWPATLYSWGV